ncbi:hypothetical protein ANME2D_01060 [Candidatus Methanoperedens nitroreducens]|uniref:Uncharacterized protein n=2 Tax=Candidatus Methanoperedens nitratireducens TaxID=1392998 RepID=A0A062VBD9_9EURY|nr:hypothetical protein ANME2D_01060 [Candidatus Methanoperedens nitroreducens]
MLHDKVWTVILTLSQDEIGTSHLDRAIELIKHSGQASIIKN